MRHDLDLESARYISLHSAASLIRASRQWATKRTRSATDIAVSQKGFASRGSQRQSPASLSRPGRRRRRLSQASGPNNHFPVPVRRRTLALSNCFSWGSFYFSVHSLWKMPSLEPILDDKILVSPLRVLRPSQTTSNALMALPKASTPKGS